jgi:hypothetical protein
MLVKPGTVLISFISDNYLADDRDFRLLVSQDPALKLPPADAFFDQHLFVKPECFPQRMCEFRSVRDPRHANRRNFFMPNSLLSVGRTRWQAVRPSAKVLVT